MYSGTSQVEGWGCNAFHSGTHHSHTLAYVHTFIYSLNDGKHSTTHCQVVTVVPCVLICLPPEPLPSPSGVSTDPSEYQETPEAHVSAPSFPCVQRSSTRLHLIAPVVPIVDHIFFSPSPSLFPFSSPISVFTCPPLFTTISFSYPTKKSKNHWNRKLFIIDSFLRHILNDLSLSVPTVKYVKYHILKCTYTSIVHLKFVIKKNSTVSRSIDRLTKNRKRTGTELVDYFSLTK